MDGTISWSSFGQLPAMFPRPIHQAFIDANCHPVCDPVSGTLIVLLVEIFQYLINEILLIIFLPLTEIGKLQQSVTNGQYYDRHFFEPSVGDTFGMISSRAYANIIGES
jgi:hypothetical protein